MGMANMPQFAVRLIANGLSEATPAVAVCNGTRPDQRHVVSTLGEIAGAAVAACFEGPVLFIVGRVIEQAPTLGIEAYGNEDAKSANRARSA
jgi:uroporphyrin-III C-methyltransferase